MAVLGQFGEKRVERAPLHACEIRNTGHDSCAHIAFRLRPGDLLLGIIRCLCAGDGQGPFGRISCQETASGPQKDPMDAILAMRSMRFNGESCAAGVGFRSARDRVRDMRTVFCWGAVADDFLTFGLARA